MINYSIIIPHFTREGTEMLSRAVSSIPIREDIEVVIVDNSLNPISPSLFDDNKMVTILYSDNKRGAGGARNDGLKRASGEWLLFMDADDFFTENAFNSFDSFIDTDNDIIFFKPTSCYSDTLELADRHYVFCKEIDEYFITGDEFDLRCNEFDVPWAKMFRADFIRENKIDFEEVPASNDVMFSLKTGLNAKKITASEDVVYCVTVTKGSITNVVSLRNLESIFNVKIRKNALLVKNGHKRLCSVANTIRKSAKYGLGIFFRFLWTALITGNLFVGYRRWFKTILSYKKRNKEYLIHN